MSTLQKKSDALPARVAADRVVAKLLECERALQFVTTIQQAKIIADVAAAQELFAHRRRLGKEIEDAAFRIQAYALRKLGELIADIPKQAGARGASGGGTRGSKKEPRVDRPPSLADLGLDKKTSHVAQRFAEQPMPVFEAIANRETTLAKVRRETKAVEIRKAVSLPDAKFRVLYADPPWAYNDKADAGSVQAGGAARHYPTMTIAELCALPIRDLCEPHAVLFLWVTSPLLFESADVIAAWGFTYKASFVWDKVKHNLGHYNSVRHEFLLICTRGSCTPDVVQLFDSVQAIERGEHSAKPPEFRRIIETLYPHGKRLELFARERVDGWDAYGYETDRAGVA